MIGNNPTCLPNPNRPLTEHAIDCLRSIAANQQPRQNFNAGVVGKLEAEGLTELFMALSPFREGGRRGIRIQWVRITESGTSLLAAFRRDSDKALTGTAAVDAALARPEELWRPIATLPEHIPEDDDLILAATGKLRSTNLGGSDEAM